LEKNLPLSAGLGGGSSDAAATLKALQILWKTEIDEERLFDFSLELGADVPACLVGEPSFVSGIGEHITPVNDFPDLYCVLANPKKPLSTPAVFKAFAIAGRPFTQPLALTPELNEGIWPLLEGTRNDLEKPAIKLLPEIKDILDSIRKQDGCRIARMSGSGATCFGLFEDEGEAAVAAAKITHDNPAWWVVDGCLSAKPRFLLHA
ncbi:MAG TPA: 4-(cytidine 5'-diphospho)-2-C-methyl-D-erythritol kinase, partial [Rhodospirillaceae bacterium]|nr:4-(cytidine 5'-diphospho)-2-C-methyl-D-erythritol kinase [Rhodospirillaceae bacterium]